jgi:hypothetical protein
MENKDQSNDQGPRLSTPNPDPTVLSTQALFREIAGLKELMEQRLKASDSLMVEKFHSIETQFQLIERQRLEQKKDAKDAIDAALAAKNEAVKNQTESSEKAIAKSENSTKEILNQQNNTFSTAHDALLRGINELKERIIAIEQQRLGAKEDRGGLYSSIGMITLLISSIIGIITFVLSRTK